MVMQAKITEHKIKNGRTRRYREDTYEEYKHEIYDTRVVVRKATREDSMAGKW